MISALLRAALAYRLSLTRPGTQDRAKLCHLVPLWADGYHPFSSTRRDRDMPEVCFFPAAGALHQISSLMVYTQAYFFRTARVILFRVGTLTGPMHLKIVTAFLLIVIFSMDSVDKVVAYGHVCASRVRLPRKNRTSHTTNTISSDVFLPIPFPPPPPGCACRSQGLEPAFLSKDHNPSVRVSVDDYVERVSKFQQI